MTALVALLIVAVTAAAWGIAYRLTAPRPCRTCGSRICSHENKRGGGTV